jgi:hypothetical protein
MLVPASYEIIEKHLEQFKPIFTKPQHRNFSTYILGLIASEGRKNIDAINRLYVDHRDQSTLNRFLTESPWSVTRLEERRLSLARMGLPVEEGSTGSLIIDDTINRKTGKHMEDAGYHYSSVEGKSVWSHDLVTSHYVNGETEYPVSLRLYVKKDVCMEKGRAFKTKIQLACEQIEGFDPPPGTSVIVVYDGWYFCRQVVEAARRRGYDWATQAESNRVIIIDGVKTNVTRLAESLPENRFREVKVRGDEYTVCGFDVWMNGLGEVRLVVSREVDGYHFYVSNRVDWGDRRVVEAYRVRQSIEVYYRDVKQNLGLEEYQVRSGRGAIIHWHLVYAAYTLLALLRRGLMDSSSRLSKVLDTIGGVCRWVRGQCLRRLVDWVYVRVRHHARPETVYRMLGV